MNHFPDRPPEYSDDHNPPPPTAPPGWYPNPDGQRGSRYWTGAEWAEPDQTNAGYLPASDPAHGIAPQQGRRRPTRHIKLVAYCALALIFLASMAFAAFRKDFGNHGATPQSAVSSPTSAPASFPQVEQPDQQQKQQEQRQQEQERQRQQEEQQRQEQERKEAASRLDPMTYDLLVSDHDYSVLLKDPDAHRGERLEIFGVVTQFDTRTGRDTFRADTGPAYALLEGPADLKVNSIVKARDPSILVDVAEGDLVRMYVEVEGTTTYRSSIGVEQTAPVFYVNMIDRCSDYEHLEIGPYKDQPQPISRYPACRS